jgi:hypothetical protein
MIRHRVIRRRLLEFQEQQTCALARRVGRRRDTNRLRRWCSTAVTAFVGAIAILIVALAAVVLGIT